MQQNFWNWSRNVLWLLHKKFYARAEKMAILAMKTLLTTSNQHFWSHLMVSLNAPLLFSRPWKLLTSFCRKFLSFESSCKKSLKCTMILCNLYLVLKRDKTYRTIYGAWVMTCGIWFRTSRNFEGPSDIRKFIFTGFLLRFFILSLELTRNSWIKSFRHLCSYNNLPFDWKNVHLILATHSSLSINK